VFCAVADCLIDTPVINRVLEVIKPKQIEAESTRTMNLSELFKVIHNCDYDDDCHSAVPALYQYIEGGGDINEIEARSGWSILHTAAEHKDIALINQMAKYGADFNIKSSDGTPAIFQALDIDIDGAIQTGSSMNFEVTLTFLKSGADYSSVDSEGNTLFDFAKSCGDVILKKFKDAITPFICTDETIA
jgi:hypothetical protein